MMVRQDLRSFWLLIATVSGGVSVVDAEPPQRSGWELAWYDEFDAPSLDQTLWTPQTSTNPTNNSLHAYVRSQVSVSGGNLVLTSEKRSYGGLRYRSGQVISRSEQKYGRWEARAKLPTSRGMWPAIWLLPNVRQYRWPSGGEIDIMENRGDEPYLTSSAFHYGTNPPYRHSYVVEEQQAYQSGKRSNYHNQFHSYAVEWEPDQIRFFVDDVHFETIHNADVGDFISEDTAPMQLVMNTAIGGDFLDNPNGATDWPQEFLVDYVHVYNKSNEAELLTFENGGFEANGGSLAHWSTFGNKIPNVQSHVEAVQSGDGSLKLYGQFNNRRNYSGVEQGLSVESGEQLRAVASALIRSADSIRGTSNAVDLKIDYYRKNHGKYGSDDYIQSDVIELADGSSRSNRWLQEEIRSTVPPHAVEARVALVFDQRSNQSGAVHVDDVFFGRAGDTIVTWPENGDGIWSSKTWLGGPYDRPTDFDQVRIRSNRVRVTREAAAHSTTVSDGGILDLAANLEGNVEIAPTGTIAGSGTIQGNLAIAGKINLQQEGDTLRASGDIHLQNPRLQLDGYSANRGNVHRENVLEGASLVGELNFEFEDVSLSHLNNGYFVREVTYSATDVQIELFAAVQGDANGDGFFNSRDLVDIFTASQYENDVSFDSTWTTGDWTGDGEFDSSDLVSAFLVGGYEQNAVKLSFVPEPNLSFGLFGVAFAWLLWVRPVLFPATD
ncbi:MAG: family 16 glycosylhydrolase [Planctomycetaceae bacterium]|nr:family 16 glycosylhydrolase [Planctomycetaceae bacterium]